MFHSWPNVFGEILRICCEMLSLRSGTVLDYHDLPDVSNFPKAKSHMDWGLKSEKAKDQESLDW